LARDVTAESPPVRELGWGMGPPSSSPALFDLGKSFSSLIILNWAEREFEPYVHTACWARH